MDEHDFLGRPSPLKQPLIKQSFEEKKTNLKVTTKPVGYGYGYGG